MLCLLDRDYLIDPDIAASVTVPVSRYAAPIWVPDQAQAFGDAQIGQQTGAQEHLLPVLGGRRGALRRGVYNLVDALAAVRRLGLLLGEE